MELPKYVYHHGNKYTIKLQQHKKSIYIASRTDYNEILTIYRECEQADWQLDKLEKIREKHLKWKNPGKYIRFRNGSYTVLIPSLPGKPYCGTYNTLKEAQHVRDEVLRGNTDILDNIKRRTKYEKRGNIQPVPGYEGKYRLIKRVDGEQINFGTFNSYDDAVAEKEFLEAHEWDIDCYDLI